MIRTQDIPCLVGDKFSDTVLAIQLLGELHGIGKSIGTLTMCMRRCRRTDSKKWIDYNNNLESLKIRHSEITSYIAMVLRVHTR